MLSDPYRHIAKKCRGHLLIVRRLVKKRRLKPSEVRQLQKALFEIGIEIKVGLHRSFPPRHETRGNTIGEAVAKYQILYGHLPPNIIIRTNRRVMGTFHACTGYAKAFALLLHETLDTDKHGQSYLQTLIMPPQIQLLPHTAAVLRTNSARTFVLHAPELSGNRDDPRFSAMELHDFITALSEARTKPPLHTFRPIVQRNAPRWINKPALRKLAEGILRPANFTEEDFAYATHEGVDAMLHESVGYASLKYGEYDTAIEHFQQAHDKLKETALEPESNVVKKRLWLMKNAVRLARLLKTTRKRMLTA